MIKPKDTISRWCKAVLGTAGVDISKFKGHSTRAASTSHLAERNFKIQDVISSAVVRQMKVFFNVSTTNLSNQTLILRRQSWIQVDITGVC